MIEELEELNQKIGTNLSALAGPSVADTNARIKRLAENQLYLSHMLQHLAKDLAWIKKKLRDEI